MCNSENKDLQVLVPVVSLQTKKISFQFKIIYMYLVQKAEMAHLWGL